MRPFAFLPSVVGWPIYTPTHTASNATTVFDLKERRCETVDLSSNRDFQLHLVPSANGTLISHLFFFFLHSFSRRWFYVCYA